MNKMIDVKKVVVFINQKISAQGLFLLALSVYLFGGVLSTTMFPVPSVFWKLCRFTAMGLVIWKVVQFDCFSLKETIFIAFLFANALLVKMIAGYSEPMEWTIFLVGAKDVSFERIAKSYFVISFSILLYAFAASMLDVIDNLQYEQGRGIRNSFGIIYPTDFAAHVFFLMLVYFYLKKDRVKIHNYMFCLLITILVYQFCKTRLDCICMAMLIAGHMALKYQKGKGQPSGRQKQSRFAICGMFSMPAAMIIMWGLTKLYDLGVPLAYNINYWISSRLRLQSDATREYGVQLFGQYIQMIGNGGSEILPGNYFFLDCSYYYIILQHGLLFGFLVLAVYVLCYRKNIEDRYFQLTIFLISLNCMIAHHLLDLAYNPFALALFAKIACRDDHGGYLSL